MMDVASTIVYSMYIVPSVSNGLMFPLARTVAGPESEAQVRLVLRQCFARFPRKRSPWGAKLETKILETKLRCV